MHTLLRLATAAALAAVLASTSLAASAQTYTAGIEASFPPWAFVEDGEKKGIAVDAMRWIAKDQGLDVTFKDLPWPSLVPALGQGRIDLLVTGLDVTRERDKVIDYSIPWYVNNDALLLPKDSELNTVTALSAGATVGVQSGSTQFHWAQENLVKNDKVDVEIKGYESVVTGVEDMMTGRTDSFLIDELTAMDFEAKRDDIQMEAVLMVRRPMALAVTDGDPHDLLAKLNKGTMNLVESGEWRRIVKKYAPYMKVKDVPGYMPEYIDHYKNPPGM